MPTRAAAPATRSEGERIGWRIVAIFVALAVPTGIAHGLDERLLNGVSVWDKPLKFQLSLALHMATLTVLLALLPVGQRNSLVIRWSMLAGAFWSFAEVLYIMLQAARGRASHFNNATPVESMGYTIMGVGAVSLVAASFVIGVVLWRHASPASGPGLRLGTGLGLTLGSVATFVTAGTMAQSLTHWVGGVPNDAGGLPLFGWSQVGGDLRVPHFFATHAMQALPLAGLLFDRLLPAAWARPFVIGATAFWLIIVVATFMQALAGQPFVSL